MSIKKNLCFAISLCLSNTFQTKSNDSFEDLFLESQNWDLTLFSYSQELVPKKGFSSHLIEEINPKKYRTGFRQWLRKTYNIRGIYYQSGDLPIVKLPYQFFVGIKKKDKYEREINFFLNPIDDSNIGFHSNKTPTIINFNFEN